MKQIFIRAALRFLWLRYPQAYMETALGREKYHIARNPPKGKRKKTESGQPGQAYPVAGE